MNISIVKEKGLLRDGMVNLLSESFNQDIFSTYSSSNYTELFSLQKLADLLIIDIDTDIDLNKLITFYKDNNKKIIVWTSSLYHHALLDLFKLNLAGYFYNGMHKHELISALLLIKDGNTYIHSDLSKVLLSDYVKITTKRIENKRPVGVLSTREWEVLECISKGLNNEEIAKVLYISDKTVKNHVSNILEKLKVKDRTNALLKAIHNDWLII